MAAMTACIVQARLASTRLPAKVLLPLPTGRTVLEEVLFRCKQISGVSVVAAAVPDTSENSILMPFLIKARVPFFLGSEHDVLSRYNFAASELRADVIMRITSDCPLIDPEVCGKTLDLHCRISRGFVSNSWPTRTYPHGFDCEVFNADLLAEAHKNATEPEDREHVTRFFQRQPHIERACLSTQEDRSHLRWTLDTLKDYVVIWSVFQEQMREAA